MKNRVKPMAKQTRRGSNSVFQRRSLGGTFTPAEPAVHVFGTSQVCATDSRGYATPKNMSPTELVLDATEGFIPLWAKDVTLRWRFNENSMSYFQDPDAAKRGVEELMADAITAWSDASPVTFTKRDDAWDFEIVMKKADNCSVNGCTVAAAFFPDGGRHQLELYPKLFSQSKKERVETLIHEIGHVFGLRHFFANVSETAWPSVVFGKHRPFTIMNYGNKSRLTKTDKSDLKRLYKNVWSSELSKVNGTRIVLVRPYHTLGTPP